MGSTGHGWRRRGPVRERRLYVNEKGAALPRTAGGSRVILLGLEHVGDDAWDGLAERGIAVLPVEDVAAAVQLLADRAAQVVVADAHVGPALIAAVRGRRDAAWAHVIVCVDHDSADRLRAALDAGADDVMRVPFEPEELVARVAAGLTAARLSANDALLRSLVANIPGALYRCACDEHWTMEWLSDEIEQISGYPASDFIDSAVRTFANVIHPEDRAQVERSVMDGVRTRRPFTLEYRIVRRDGGVRWVLERGQLQEAEDGRRWLDGAIFDITVRRAAEQALHEREIAEAQLAEVRASRARIVEATDRARREIERNLHDGAQHLPSCGTSRTGCTPPCSATEGSSTPWPASPVAPACPSSCRSSCGHSGCRRWSRRPRTSRSARRSPTSPSTPTRHAHGSASSATTATSTSRSKTTASAV